MTEKSEERIYREAKKRINMRKNGIHPSDYFEGWVVDYIDSSTTDELSVEKLQEIRVEELKDFNSKILQAELKNQKLQKEIDAAKKYIEESYKADKEDNKLLDLIIEAVAKLKSDNEILKKALTEIASTRQWRGGTLVGFEATEDAQIAINALAAIGGDDEN